MSDKHKGLMPIERRLAYMIEQGCTRFTVTRDKVAGEVWLNGFMGDDTAPLLRRRVYHVVNYDARDADHAYRMRRRYKQAVNHLLKVNP